jgi:hypothetical protein
VYGAAEVVAVLRLLQPPPLAVGLAGFTADGLIAVALPLKISGIRQKQLFAMTTFPSRDSDHRPTTSVGRCYRITEPRGEIKSLEENAEENKKIGFLK